jgi:ADP-heptose:LPS heptosyltransferase
LKKVLIIRFSSIGDIVLTSPVIRCLKSQSPETEVHYLTKKQNYPLLKANPYLSKIWLYDQNFSELVPLLQSEDFSFIIDLHNNFRSRFVIFKLSRPSAGFPKLNFKKWLLVNFRINLLPDIHIVDRYFSALQKLKIHNDGKGLDHFIPSDEEVDFSGMIPGGKKEYIAFSIGGKHNTKILPEEKIIALCKGIKGPVLLLGGSEDQERAERIANSAGNHVINFCGTFSINQSASLIRQTQLVITHDTGLMHIAAAFRKPIFSIWGNTIPAFGMYPYLPDELCSTSKTFEVKGLSCRPCSKIGFERCPKHHFRCMNDQDLNGIIKAIRG